MTAKRPRGERVWRALRFAAGLGLIGLVVLAWVWPGAAQANPDAIPLRLAASVFCVLVAQMILPRD